jgi:hypothetical protein
MHPILALQGVALVLALLMVGPATGVTPPDRPPKALIVSAPTEPARLRCRLYFGCAPAPRASAESAGN